jgi:hypothetical protein
LLFLGDVPAGPVVPHRGYTNMASSSPGARTTSGALAVGGYVVAADATKSRAARDNGRAESQIIPMSR